MSLALPRPQFWCSWRTGDEDRVRALIMVMEARDGEALKTLMQQTSETVHRHLQTVLINGWSPRAQNDTKDCVPNSNDGTESLRWMRTTLHVSERRQQLEDVMDSEKPRELRRLISTLKLAPWEAYAGMEIAIGLHDNADQMMRTMGRHVARPDWSLLMADRDLIPQDGATEALFEAFWRKLPKGEQKQGAVELMFKAIKAGQMPLVQRVQAIGERMWQEQWSQQLGDCLAEAQHQGNDTLVTWLIREAKADPADGLRALILTGNYEEADRLAEQIEIEVLARVLDEAQEIGCPAIEKQLPYAWAKAQASWRTLKAGDSPQASALGRHRQRP